MGVSQNESRVNLFTMPSQGNVTERNSFHNLPFVVSHSPTQFCRVQTIPYAKWFTYVLKRIGSTKTEDLHRLLPEEWTE